MTELKSERVDLRLANRGQHTEIHVYCCHRCGVQEAFTSYKDAADWHRVMGMREHVDLGTYFCGHCFYLLKAIADGAGMESVRT